MDPEKPENVIPPAPLEITVQPEVAGKPPGASGSPLRSGKRPATSKRVGFALGQEGQDRIRRLTNAMRIYSPVDISRSEMMRIILEFVEETILRAGDEALRGAVQRETLPPNSPSLQFPESPDPVSLQVWLELRHRVSQARQPSH